VDASLSTIRKTLDLSRSTMKKESIEFLFTIFVCQIDILITGNGRSSRVFVVVQ
jgi:hypothetical protein